MVINGASAEGGTPRPVLVAGGTGNLGTHLIPRLLAKGTHVRVLTRHPERATALARQGVELCRGDLADRAAVDRAMVGVSTVISAAQGGFGATDGATPASVDTDGNANLIAAALTEGVEHFVLVSIIDARGDHPLELWRRKYDAERALMSSGLAWTVVASAAFMDWAATQYVDPLLATGRTTVFGRGEMPINFVAADDVAAVVEQALSKTGTRGQRIPVAGPENLTLNQIIDAAQRLRDQPGKVRHVPVRAMRVMAGLTKLLKPALSREIRAGIYLDTTDRMIQPMAAHATCPDLTPTLIGDFLSRRAAERRPFDTQGIEA